MKKTTLQKMICTALTVGISCSGAMAAAEEAEYSFDPVVVTALRAEKNDLNTPAYVNVLSEKQLKETGTNNLLDALKFVEGITYDGYGPSGHLYSSMTAKATIRGMDRGTVILVNGVPTNMSGYYALERMPLNNIEKVEIVKGSASVLYGSSALGGVINIITKDKVDNSAHIEYGSFGRKTEDVSLQLGKMAVSANHSEQGDMGAVSDPWSSNNKDRKYSAFRGDTKDSIRWNWKFNDNIILTHQHDVDDFTFDRVQEIGNKLDEKIKQRETKDYVGLQVKHGVWKSNLYANQLSREYNKFDKKGKTTADTDTEFATLGLDSQTSWKTPFGDYTAGVAWQNERFNVNDDLLPASNKSTSYTPLKERDFYSVFAQITHPLSENRDLIFGARQEIIQQKDANNYSEFCPQLQIITRISPDQSWYINTGRAFKMPNMSDMYGSTWRKTANANLDPEYGYNYEIGWKQSKEDHSLKAAIYHMDFTNYIQWAETGKGSGNYVPYNTKFRNTGIEVAYDKKVDKNLSYKLGCSVSNPQEQAEGADWQANFAKLQVTGGLTYHNADLSASLSATYLGNRKDDRKPTLPVNLAVQYNTSQDTTLHLRVENLFDRNDIVSHGASQYRATSRAINVGLTTKF